MTAADLLVLARVVKDTLWARLPSTEAPRLAAGVLEVVPALAAQAEAHRLEIVRLDGELAKLRESHDKLEHTCSTFAVELLQLRPILQVAKRWRDSLGGHARVMVPAKLALEAAVDAALAKETP